MNVEDRDARVFARFDAENEARIRALVNDEVIAEHGAEPVGIHSDRLQRILAYFRRGPIADKYIVVAESPFERYRIGVLRGQKGQVIDLQNEVYPTEKAVLHAIFLRRLSDIGATR